MPNIKKKLPAKNKYNLYLFSTFIMQTLLLLHGAIGASTQLKSLADNLGKEYAVHTFDFSGHGGKAYRGAFTMQLFVQDVLEYMELHKLEKVSIFGYSMGGYVGMCLAKSHPEKVDKIVTLATKYSWDEAIAAKEVQMLNPDKIEQKLPAFAATLAERHASNDWKAVLRDTADMMVGLGQNNTLKAEDYAGIATPSLILLGDRDKMVGLDETVTVYKALPNARMAMLPNTHHPIEQINMDALVFMVRQFLG